MTVFYVIAALFMFGILITVHEAGHFLAARLTGIPVREFSVGFGPPLFGWTGKKHETAFRLRLIPLGGYCAFYGEDSLSGPSSEDPRAFAGFSVPRRLLVIVMGAVMNLLLAYLAAVLFYAVSGVPQAAGGFATQVSAVEENSPAGLAGMQAGDRFLSVNGETVSDNLSELINAHSRQENLPLRIRVERGEGEGAGPVDLEVAPRFDPEAGRFRIGIEVLVGQPLSWKPGTPGEVLGAAYSFCLNSAKAIFNAIRRLVTSGEGASEMTGVVGIIQLVVEETRQTKLQGYLSLMTLISINLGLFNMLPVPGLDGSKLLFLLLEALRGKPVKREAYVHLAGMILLFALMALIGFRDILRLFQGMSR